MGDNTVPGEIGPDGEFVEYQNRSTEDLIAQVRLYRKAVTTYRHMQDRGKYLMGGTFYDESEVMDNGGPDKLCRKYDATEDLAFLYTELGAIYRILFERQG